MHLPFGPLGQRPTQGRKYVDLLFRTTNAFANWQPTIPLTVGDYGRVNKTTGLFIRDGNIYEDDLAAVYGLTIETPKAHAKETEVVFMSRHAKSTKTKNSADLSVSSAAAVSFSLSLTFRKERGAALILVSPEIISIPNEGRLRPLFSHPPLLGRCIVTQVYRCPAYAMLFTDGHDCQTSISFSAASPLAAAAGVTVGGGAEAGWNAEAKTGSWRLGHDETGRDVFFPLCGLRSFGSGIATVDVRQDGPDMGAYDEFLPITPTPWGQLDENGEEEFDEECDS